MKISEAWLRNWVNPTADTQEIVAKITMAGLEVDAVTKAAKDFTGVVVAEIVSAEQHPDADKLRVCLVDKGDEQVQIVCGAPNARAGLRVPLATVGGVLPGDFKIRKAKLRGVESFGMLCAREELGVEGDSSGLWELPSDAPVGQNIREYLNLDDNIIDVDLTPNRADCLSLRGVAREVGVIFNTDVTYPTISDVAGTGPAQVSVEVTSPSACPRYLGRAIRGLDLTKTTPFWMQDRLEKAGLRCIDLAVDITNYIMLELGQPMHAFDLAFVDNGLVVRDANAGEKITLLDGKEVSLKQGTLVIASQDKPVAIAGIMGGEHSGVNDTTSEIFLECAYFSPLAIAGKAREYGLHTDSSHRFERGVDSELQHQALQRATELFVELAGGQPSDIIAVESPEHLPKAADICLRKSRLESLIGCQFDYQQVTDILNGLGMTCLDVSDTEWRVRAPSWRFDMQLEVDLIEEIARVYGYDKLPEATLSSLSTIAAHTEETLDIRRVRRQLVSAGMYEAITYSFIDPELHATCFPDEPFVQVQNPISADMSVMRTSLVPGLLATAKYNLNRQQSRVRIFETGLCFAADKEYSQQQKIAAVVTGHTVPEQWGDKPRPVDFFDIKNDLQQLLQLGGQRDICFKASDALPLAHPGQCASIELEGETIGWLAKLHPGVQSELGISSDTFFFEVNLDAVLAAKTPLFAKLNRFPEVRRDLAFVVNESVCVENIVEAITSSAGSLLQRVNIFDIYRGQGIDSTEKSIALGLTFRDSSRTLNDQEIAEAVSRVVNQLESDYSVRLR